jgi:YHS domain-containing protein
MRFTYTLVAAVALSIAGMTLHAEDAKADKKAKPYPLKKCVVSDEDIGGGDMKPYVWVYKGQEIKMCCKDCKKDFMKEPEKYMKKLANAQKAQK